VLRISDQQLNDMRFVVKGNFGGFNGIQLEKKPLSSWWTGASMMFGSQSTYKIGLQLLIQTYLLVYNFSGGFIFTSLECVSNASMCKCFSMYQGPAFYIIVERFDVRTTI